jgi:hypothetical protein
LNLFPASADVEVYAQLKAARYFAARVADAGLHSTVTASTPHRQYSITKESNPLERPPAQYMHVSKQRLDHPGYAHFASHEAQFVNDEPVTTWYINDVNVMT